PIGEVARAMPSDRRGEVDGVPRRDMPSGSRSLPSDCRKPVPSGGTTRDETEPNGTKLLSGFRDDIGQRCVSQKVSLRAPDQFESRPPRKFISFALPRYWVRSRPSREDAQQVVKSLCGHAIVCRSSCVKAWTRPSVASKKQVAVLSERRDHASATLEF